MTKLEAKETCEDVFSEYLPKLKKAEKESLIAELLMELQDRGLEFEEAGYEVGDDPDYDELDDRD